jgi:hypothetical protein
MTDKTKETIGNLITVGGLLLFILYGMRYGW